VSFRPHGWICTALDIDGITEVTSWVHKSPMFITHGLILDIISIPVLIFGSEKNGFGQEFLTNGRNKNYVSLFRILVTFSNRSIP
jgi:hypothetical protein